jgi:hypothetical protein
VPGIGALFISAISATAGTRIQPMRQTGVRCAHGGARVIARSIRRPAVIQRAHLTTVEREAGGRAPIHIRGASRGDVEPFDGCGRSTGAEKGCSGGHERRAGRWTKHETAPEPLLVKQRRAYQLPRRTTTSPASLFPFERTRAASRIRCAPSARLPRQELFRAARKRCPLCRRPDDDFADVDPGWLLDGVGDGAGKRLRATSRTCRGAPEVARAQPRWSRCRGSSSG